ncbi:unnamed protein product [Trichogramma brassicae]|uniref:Bromodomain adjacent to zinc finger domain protein 1A n=1 Tax=Trichogramma brassicae TaxID=86971 RepID=A0A6H5I694_9HYME|nr:unnamed protein product [Trichogramma brassicae]
MPLLRKKPFQRLHVSSDFRDDDEVFHCAVTNEIFKDYNEFCERIILCNSMIWSCSITGKSGMTYEEALLCEENAKESLKEFPMELRIPILYLANKTQRTSLSDMIDDVFQYARERYFIGEMVEASFTEDSWCECHVLQVIEPTDQQIKAYNQENKLNGKFKEELKAKALEEKAKRQEERLEIKERKKEEKIKQAALAVYVKSWNKPREDLECEDLKPLPSATPIKSELYNEKFGEFAMILEFLEFFREEIEVKAYFHNGVTLDILEKAMMEKDVTGPLNDLIQLLLANIFKYQAEEEDEIHAESQNAVSENDIDTKVSSMVGAVKLATQASSWCQTHQGCQLSELALDNYTMSEILRQHLLSSGGRISEAASKWRYSQRGGYTNHDDPALLLRIEKPRILRALGHGNICDFDLEDRLTVVICLMNQLLTFASIRDVIDERYEKLFQAKKDLKSFIIAEQKREKEERDKQKEKEKEKEKDGKVEEVKEEDLEPKKVTRNNYKEEKKKEDYENKLRELQQASKDDQMMLLLGSDRAYRKYWRLLSIPGIFVENIDELAGTCLPEGTPYMPELLDSEVLHSYLKNKFEDECSDKENNVKKVKTPKKVNVDKNGVKSQRTDIRKSVMACTGNKDCPVHVNKSSSKWSFYGKIEDIDKLINALSERGIRESELKNNLIHEKESIISAIIGCPKHKFNPDIFPEPDKEVSKASKKKVDNVHSNYPPEMPINTILELNLRDYVLDLEDKIKMGCLGTLKVQNREAWRSAISNGKYDKQCDKLVYGLNETPADFGQNTMLDSIKKETKTSRPGTPDSEVGTTAKVYRDPGKFLGPPEENETTADLKHQKAIKQMACAILQISYAIDHKYLKKPLGSEEKDKKNATEEAIDRWQQSLMASTSWSQLFVHLNTLDNSIQWSRSALNAQCRVCRKRRDAENMLLCDGCNKGHHLYCLKPKLTCVPSGDWFCSVCKPRETKQAQRTRRRRQFEEEIEDETSYTRETRHTRARKVLSDEEDNESEKPVKDELESDDEMSNSPQLCTMCGNDGKLIVCEGCNKHYHTDCHEPPLQRPPRGRWTCTSCKSRKSNNHNTSDDIEHTRHTRRSAKRAAEVEHEAEVKLTVKGCKAQIQELLNDIKKHRQSWPFLEPVGKDEVPDYYDYISEPMDFGTIQKKFSNNQYTALKDFFHDCLLVFDNCHTYNSENSQVYKAGQKLLQYFEKRCKDLNLHFNEDEIRQPNQKIPKLEKNGKHNGVAHSDDEDVEMNHS